ncbi:MAG: hypothetical protein NZM44_03930 [Candidatus Calescibacterium sp.]|nr:hypothetical protein [Candidatus Calescibacterium sp.]MCS7243509.1 hypothetical protein [Candidatus Calescibacterium sp.]MDW8132427.1 hypothetical protein [Candidatus Calescibacterium sp.]
MYGGKLINLICRQSALTLLNICKSQKKPEYGVYIKILNNLARIFSILSELDSELYKIYLTKKQEKKKYLKKIINYPILYGINFSLLLLFLTTKLKLHKSLKVDVKIIQRTVVNCIISNIELLRENMRVFKE